MSTYSEQINTILRDRLIPKMRELSLEVAKIEPFSYSNTRLEDSKRQLDYMSMIYDFLYEYQIGVEELDNGKLINVVRLIDPPTRERKTLEMLRKGRTAPTKPKSGYKLYINKLEVKDDTVITPGQSITITAIYTPAKNLLGEKSITLVVDGVAQTSNGFTIVLQNKEVPLEDGGTQMVIGIQPIEDGGAPIAPYVKVIPIDNVIDSSFYYGVGAKALNVGDLQSLTQFWEPRSTKTLVFNPSNEVYYFAYPVNYGDLTMIRDTNGFDITSDFTKRVETFTLSLPNYSGGTADYNVYEFDNLTTQTNFTITFNF
jgi:hypothetical protein